MLLRRIPGRRPVRRRSGHVAGLALCVGAVTACGAGVSGSTTIPAPPTRATAAVSGPAGNAMAPPQPEPSAVVDPVLVAAGDIACDPAESGFNGGRGGEDECLMGAVSDAILAEPRVDAVAALGDVQYECGGAQAFARSYEPTWGRLKAITYPAVGNHEYLSEVIEGDVATDCDESGRAAGYYSYYGARAGAPNRGYYSYDLGAWHVIVLNTQCRSAGGCRVGSPQERWLRADLAAHRARCTLAYFHIPRWSSGGRANANSAPFIAALVEAGADVVLAGHDHTYERFAPMDAAGRPSARGVRSFVVGTGGSNHTSLVSVAPNSQVRDDTTFGYLRLTLHPTSYDWTFVPIGDTFSDGGTSACH